MPKQSGRRAQSSQNTVPAGTFRHFRLSSKKASFFATVFQLGGFAAFAAGILAMSKGTDSLFWVLLLFAAGVLCTTAAVLVMHSSLERNASPKQKKR
ncbi:MAG TPA: hypothetical protein PK597_06220 [Oscillospiraceae bacterium]|nr:hypothetical protein [Oscillospiraceae bacterium]